MRKLLITFIFLLLAAYPQFTLAAKRLLPRFRSSGGSIYNRPLSSGVAVSPQLRGDKRALVVYFSGLQAATSVTYSLIYNTNGKPEGVGGTIRSSEGNTANRTLLFGTCSAGVCRYHVNITNMRFEVVSKLTSGKTSIKRYRVRI